MSRHPSDSGRYFRADADCLSVETHRIQAEHLVEPLLGRLALGGHRRAVGRTLGAQYGCTLVLNVACDCRGTPGMEAGAGGRTLYASLEPWWHQLEVELIFWRHSQGASWKPGRARQEADWYSDGTHEMETGALYRRSTESRLGIWTGPVCPPRVAGVTGVSQSPAKTVTHCTAPQPGTQGGAAITSHLFLHSLLNPRPSAITHKRVTKEVHLVIGPSRSALYQQDLPVFWQRRILSCTTLGSAMPPSKAALPHEIRLAALGVASFTRASNGTATVRAMLPRGPVGGVM
ncbi:hypothetical protein NDU88_006864 [Pleurodeles waltl]|uniref:Uncharacterized protein n=1 Tax=Pleurodeles waltl TaxID=8319 RepID=A0AAV7TZR3_PLEWA|nr:hypothetical protein NDU88_006864 [Pleurodeles waltl]